MEKSTHANDEVKSWIWFPSGHELLTHYFREIGFLASFAQFCGASESSTTSVTDATRRADFDKPSSGFRASQLCRASTTKCHKVCLMGSFGPRKSLEGPVSLSRGMFLPLLDTRRGALIGDQRAIHARDPTQVVYTRPQSARVAYWIVEFDRGLWFYGNGHLRPM